MPKCLFSSGDLKSYTTEISNIENYKFEGEVGLKVEYSSLNYKDALGLMAQGKIYRKLPMIGGIDAAGELVDGPFKGQRALVTGCGIGESQFGGYSELLRTKKEYLIPLPSNINPRTAMILGTAGFTAGMALYRMEKNGQKPKMGPIAISGASGGVGMLACHLFSQKGYEVIAISRKKQCYETLEAIGAKKVVALDDLTLGERPLESIQFGGVVDNIGGNFAAKALAHINLFGNFASIGLAMAPNFKTSVMPHILRGVSILGISSSNCPLEDRLNIWQLLNENIEFSKLEKIYSKCISLEELFGEAKKMLAGQTYGRTIVKL